MHVHYPVSCNCDRIISSYIYTDVDDDRDDDDDGAAVDELGDDSFVGYDSDNSENEIDESNQLLGVSEVGQLTLIQDLQNLKPEKAIAKLNQYCNDYPSIREDYEKKSDVEHMVDLCNTNFIETNNSINFYKKSVSIHVFTCV